ncbi:MAG: 50S ribosomal protein L25 [Bacteroidales bacterium]|nr:50S ribosomal protein L25 [Bacteroidales bacterium]
MRIVSLSGSLRENVGKKDAKALRREDKVPCVMYGKGEQVTFAVPQNEFQRILFNPAPCFVEIDLNGQKRRAMMKDIQFHPVTEIVYHADFYELSDDKPIVMSIPVHTTGTSVGVMKGGKLAYKQKRLNVKALPANMPSEVLLDITKLDIAQRIKVQDIATENYEILNPKSSEVVVVNSTRAAAMDTTTAEGEASPAAE